MDGMCSYCGERRAIGSISVRKWVGLGDDVKFAYCSEQCKADIQFASVQVQKGTPWFFTLFALIMVLTVVLVITTVLMEPHTVMSLMGGLMILAGAWLAGFPLIASNMVQTVGIRHAKKYARAVGWIFIAIGAAVVIVFI